MSQPFDRSACIPAPKRPDDRLKDWWVENPFAIAANGKSLSGYERNRIYLNSRGQTFFEISGLTSADSEGDARGVVASDFTGDGLPDLLVRQAGGGTLLYFENQFPKASWLRVSLEGRKSNRQGIGARLTAEVGGQKIVRELYPANGFMSQNPAHVHFGLGKAARLDRLTIAWPSGVRQEFTNLEINRAIRIAEDSAQVHAALTAP